MGTAEYIKAFKVASSFDGNTYTTYKVDGQRRDKVRPDLVLDIINMRLLLNVPAGSLFSFSLLTSFPASVCCRFSWAT